MAEEEVQTDITMPAISLLMESVRLQDELPLLQEKVGDPARVFRQKASHLTWADAFATSAFVMGVDGIEWVTRFDGYRALAITLDGDLVRSDAQWA